jgi:hypothetical protein
MAIASAEAARQDARKTHLYLRLGIIGAVVLLATSILLEYAKAGCIQTSVSAYYYTPVRAIFVGSLCAVGLSLIVFKGRTIAEDATLNGAGMLAPVVAVAPTIDVGGCYSVAPNPLPVEADGSLATWVVTNIQNNFNALLIAGAIGLGVALVIAFVSARLAEQSIPDTVRRVDLATRISLAGTAAALVIGWSLSASWDDFDTKAHGWAAVAMFGFLILAIVFRAWSYRQQNDAVWRIYVGVAVLMVLGAAVIVGTRVFGRYTVFWLETWEIFWFLGYWLAQTVKNWRETLEQVHTATTVEASRPIAGPDPVVPPDPEDR